MQQTYMDRFRSGSLKVKLTRRPKPKLADGEIRFLLEMGFEPRRSIATKVVGTMIVVAHDDGTWTVNRRRRRLMIGKEAGIGRAASAGVEAAGLIERAGLPKAHQGVYYWATKEMALAHAQLHQLTYRKIMSFRRGWAIKLKATGASYVGPKERT